MKNRNRVVFAVIVLLVAISAYLAVFGIDLDRYVISPYRDEIKLGLDLSGGVYVVLEAVTDATGSELDEKISQARAIIEQRVDGLGVAEPNITVENGDRIRIELAGLTNPQDAIELRFGQSRGAEGLSVKQLQGVNGCKLLHNSESGTQNTIYVAVLV